MLDLQGRPWATVSETKAGSAVRTDGDFTCIAEGQVLIVQAREDGALFIPCDEGGHDLVGQLSDDGTHYVGLYPAVA